MINEQKITIFVLFALFAYIITLLAVRKWLERRNEARQKPDSQPAQPNNGQHKSNHIQCGAGFFVPDEHGWDAQENRHHAIERFYWRTTFFLSVILACGAVVSAYYAYSAYTEARTATRQAMRQADAAEKQLAAADRSSMQQLRAYVGLHRAVSQTGWARVVELICPDCEANTPAPPTTGPISKNYLGLLIKNFGQTPAYLPSVCAGVVRVEHGESITTDFADGFFSMCNTQNAYQSTLWPSEERPSNVYLDNRRVETIKMARDQSADAIFIGRITYKDIFGAVHHSYFCYIATYVDNRGAFVTCGTPFQQDD